MSEKIGNYRWRVVALLFFATTINYVDRQILGMLKPYIAGEFALTEAGYGYIVSVFQGAYAIGLLCAGHLIDRFGTRISYAVAVVVWSLAGALHAAARSAFGFGMARAFLGLGESANFPAAIKATAEWFPRKERALATGIFNAGSNMGALIAPVIVSLITVAYGWQWAFILTGAIGFVWVICWLLFFRLPQQSPRLSPAERTYILEEEPGSTSAGESEKISWRRLLGRRTTVGICLARFSTDWVWWFFLFWTPDFLYKMYGVEIMQMMMPLIVIYAFAALGGVAGGALSSAMIARGSGVLVSRRRAMLLCALCVVPVMALPSLDSLWAAVCLIGVAAFAHQGWASNIFTLVSDLYPKGAVGSLTGLAGFCASIGGILAALFVGQVLQSTGSYFLIFLIASLAYLFGWAILQFFLPKHIELT